MKTAAIWIAALSLAAPAFAQDYGYGSYSGDDDWSWQQDEDAPPPPEAGPTYDDFRNDSELSWNGEWVSTPEYGVVWRPTRVRDDWQPYMYGRWVPTRAGWAWASDEPFGWAVYHYGRWAWSPDLGWAWVPGRVWAPAWVSWSWNDGYTGWCPLGPAGAVYRQPSLWVVVPSRQFLQPVSRAVVPRYERQRLPMPEPRGPRAGPPVTVVERATGHSVRPLAIGDGSSPAQTRAGSGTVYFYRPRTAPVAAPPRPEAREREPARTPAGSPRPWGAPQRPSASPAPQPAPANPSGPRAAPPRPAAAPAPAPAPRAATPRATAPQKAPPHEVTPKSNGEQPKAQER